MRARRGSRLPTLLAVAVLVSMAACGGRGEEQAADGSGGEAGGAAAHLPVSAPTGEIDERLAEKGEELFRTRGCISCHTIGGGRRVGPDLEGITERRDFAWTYHMVTNPDSMLKHDSTARRLLGEYFTPMADQNVTPEQFRAIYEYLREESGEKVSAVFPGTKSDDVTEGPPAAHGQRQHHACC